LSFRKLSVYAKFINILLLLFFASSLLYISCVSQKKLQIELQFHGRFLYDRLGISELPWSVWANSVEGRNIYLLEISEGSPVTVIFGAFHGSEPLSGEFALQFAEFLYNEYNNYLDCKVVIIPAVNPDGLVQGKRTNANGVDINRNFPTENWTKNYTKKSQYPGEYPASEPETQAVIKILEKYQPDKIISIHTPLKMVNYNGPAKKLAFLISERNGYPVSHYIGYPTPGLFGTYAGVERNIPTITLELPREPLQKVWEENREALFEAIKYDKNFDNF